MPIPALNYFAINNYGLYGFRLLMRDSNKRFSLLGRLREFLLKTAGRQCQQWLTVAEIAVMILLSDRVSTEKRESFYDDFQRFLRVDCRVVNENQHTENP